MKKLFGNIKLITVLVLVLMNFLLGSFMLSVYGYVGTGIWVSLGVLIALNIFVSNLVRGISNLKLNRKSFYISLIMVFIVSTFYIYYVRPHHVAFITVTYNGKIVSPENYEVIYNSEDGSIVRTKFILSPKKDGSYIIWKGDYQFNRFTVKLKPSALGLENFKPFGYTFSYFTNSSMYQTTYHKLEINQVKDQEIINCKVTIYGKGDLPINLISSNLSFKPSEFENIVDIGSYGP